MTDHNPANAPFNPDHASHSQNARDLASAENGDAFHSDAFRGEFSNGHADDNGHAAHDNGHVEGEEPQEEAQSATPSGFSERAFRADEAAPDAQLSPDDLQRRGEEHVSTADQKAEDGDFTGALSDYKRAARLDPSSPQRLLKLAEGYAAADQPERALEAYGRALEASRNNEEALPDAYVGLGDLCRTVANSAAAVRSYERAVRARPKKPFYRWKLAVALTALGLFDQAETQLRQTVEIAPDDTFYNFYLADLLTIMNRESEAIAIFTRVVQLAPRDEYYRLRLAAALLRANRSAEALPHFERLAAAKPDNDAYRALLRYARIRDARDPEIALDVEMTGLGPYDRDFVRRTIALCEPTSARQS